MQLLHKMIIHKKQSQQLSTHYKLGQINNNFILILDESVTEEDDKMVGFNLKSIKQIRFDQPKVLAEKLKENIVKFYGLQQVDLK